MNSMRIIAIAGFASMVATSAFSADMELNGTYTLISATSKMLDTGEVRDTYGAKPKGFITYGRDGRMMALLVSDNRPKPETVEKMTDQQRVDLFRTMTAYGGTYKFDGKSVEHHIDISWNEVWTGTTAIRDIRKDGNRLIYTTRPAPSGRDGRMSVTTLVWEKLK